MAKKAREIYRELDTEVLRDCKSYEDMLKQTVKYIKTHYVPRKIPIVIATVKDVK